MTEEHVSETQQMWAI